MTLIHEAAMTDVPAGMIRLRKADGSGAGCGCSNGIAYEPDADGCVLVPLDAMGVLCEAHGFETAPEEEHHHRLIPRHVHEPHEPRHRPQHARK